MLEFDPQGTLMWSYRPKPTTESLSLHHVIVLDGLDVSSQDGPFPPPEPDRRVVAVARLPHGDDPCRKIQLRAGHELKDSSTPRPAGRSPSHRSRRTASENGSGGRQAAGARRGGSSVGNAAGALVEGSCYTLAESPEGRISADAAVARCQIVSRRQSSCHEPGDGHEARARVRGTVCRTGNRAHGGAKKVDGSYRTN